MRVFTADYEPQYALQKEVVEHAGALLQQGADRKNAVQTPEQAAQLRLEYLETVKSAFPAALFERPARPASEEVSQFDFEEFSITNYRIEALYGRQANLSLYKPCGGGEAKYFPVIMPTGHSGKTRVNYQGIAQFFAKCGYIVALFDSIGQGELEYHNDHFICGVTGYLTDIWSQTHFVGDALCMIDYMQTRADVDSSRGFAMTGVSGGGTTTLYCAMLDERVKISAPSCCISPHAHIHLKDLYTTCPECFGKGYLRGGVDAGDYIWLAAPKPQLILCGKLDTVFDVAATTQAFEDAARLYSLLGNRENLNLFADDCPHMYSFAMAAKTVHFFDAYFGKATSSNTREDMPVTLFEAEIIAAYPVKTVNMYEINRAAALRHEHDRAAKGVMTAGQAAKQLVKLLDITPQDSAVPKSEIDDALPVRMGRKIDKVILSGSSSIKTPALLVYSPTAEEKAPCLIFADDNGKFAGFKKDGFLSRVSAVTKNDATAQAVFAMELAGFGELRSESNPYDTVFWNNIVRILSYLSAGAGRPIAHYWVKSLLEAKLYLDSTNSFLPDLHLGGRGESAVAALLAAVAGVEMGMKAQKLLLIDMPASYRGMTEHMPYAQSELMLIPDILRYFDLPELLHTLENCEILIINPRDGSGAALPLVEAQRIFSPSKTQAINIVCSERAEDIKSAVGGMFERKC